MSAWRRVWWGVRPMGWGARRASMIEKGGLRMRALLLRFAVVIANAVVCNGALAGEKEEAAASARSWLHELQGATSTEAARRIGLVGARKPRIVNEVLADLLAHTDLKIDPVRIAIRLDAIDTDIVQLAVHLATAQRLLRSSGPRLTEAQRISLRSCLAGGGPEAAQLATLAVHVLEVIPNTVRKSIESRLRRSPPDADALAAVLMAPEIVQTPAIVDHLVGVAHGSDDPVLVASAAMVSGRREDGAERLLVLLRETESSDDARRAIEMLGILRVRESLPGAFAFARERPEFARDIYRSCRVMGIPDALYPVLTALLEEDGQLAIIAARLLYVDAAVSAELFPGLVELAAKKSAPLRELAAWGLGRYAQRGFQGSRVLAQLTADESAGVRWMALGAAAHADPDGDLRECVVRAAQAGDRAAVEGMKTLFLWDDEGLRAVMRRHVEGGGAIATIPEMAAQRGWDEIIEICRACTAGRADNERASAVLASLVRAAGTAWQIVWVQEWSRLSNSVALAAARRWYEAGGDVLPEVVLRDVEARLWSWGDAEDDEMQNRLFAVGVLASSGRMGKVEYGDAVMRILAVLMEEEYGNAYMEMWRDLAGKVDRGVLPMRYLERMSRNPWLQGEVRYACGSLLGGE